MGGGTRLGQQQDVPSGKQHIFCNKTLTPIYLLGSVGPGDRQTAAPKLVQQKRVWVQSSNPMDLDDSNPDPAASDISLGHHLDETDQSQLIPCNSLESSPVPERVIIIRMIV